MNLVYIGNKFYHDSHTRMSSVYTEDGERTDFGKIQMALERGEEVHIRQATPIEMAYYQADLDGLLKAKSTDPSKSSVIWLCAGALCPAAEKYDNSENHILEDGPA